MDRLLESTTFQFGMIILFVSGLAAGFTEDLTWKDWTTHAMAVLAMYTTKEVGRRIAEK